MSNLGLTIWKHTVHNPSMACEKYRDPEMWVTCVMKRDGSVEVTKHKTQRGADKEAGKYHYTENSEEVVGVVLSPCKGQGHGNSGWRFHDK